MQKFDLIVIGSGPAGQRGAIQGAKLGKHVALIERRDGIGGASINTGTIPSKTMREAVVHLSGYQYQPIYGMNYRVKDKITIEDFIFRVQQVIRAEANVMQSQLSRNGIEVFHGVASLIDSTHVKLTSVRGVAEFEADKILIAVGTRPAESTRVPINGRTNNYLPTKARHSGENLRINLGMVIRRR